MLRKVFSCLLVLQLLFGYKVLAQSTATACPDTPIEEAIINGDFELGNDGSSSFGLHKDFAKGTLSYSMPGDYFIDNDGGNFNGTFGGIVEPKAAGGNFLMVDALEAPNSVMWEQTVTIYSNQEYYFSAFLTSLSNDSKAELKFEVTGDDGVTTVLGGSSFTAPNVGTWSQFYEKWSSGTNTTATIRLLNANGSGQGNDLAIDDISFINGCQNTAGGIVPDLGDDFSICYNGAPVTLASTPALTGLPPGAKIFWKKLSGTSGLGDMPAETDKPSITISSPGKYQVCLDIDGCFRAANVEVLNTIDFDLGPNKEVCTEQSEFLDTKLSGSALSYTWKKGATTVGGNTPSYTVPAGIPVGSSETYSVTVHSTNGDCADVTDNIILTGKDCFTVLAKSDSTTLCIGNSTRLFAETNGFVQKWESPAGTTISTNATPTVSPLVNTTYTVTANFPANILSVNGDFENKNSGFISSFTYKTKDNLNGGEFGVVKGNESWLNDALHTASDHTTGTGSFMISKVANDRSSNMIYSQEIAVQSGKEYGFSFYLRNLLPTPTTGAPANVEIWINNVKQLSVKGPADNQTWAYNSVLWNSTIAGNVKFEIRGETYPNYMLRIIGIDDVVIAEAGNSETSTVTVNVNDCSKLTATANKLSACVGDPVIVSAETNGFVEKWVNDSIPTTILGSTSNLEVIPSVLGSNKFTVTAQFPLTKIGVNGDFESGYTGFISTLQQQNGTQLNHGEFKLIQGNESFLDGAGVLNTKKDHTSGSGYFLVSNVNKDNTTKTLYSTTVNITTAGDYGFSFWLINVNKTLANSIPANLELWVAGTKVADITNPADNNWHYYSHFLPALLTGNVTVEIRGAAFATSDGNIRRIVGIDDVVFAKTGNSKTATVEVTGTDCRKLIPRDDTTACIGVPIKLYAETNGYITQWSPDKWLSDANSSSPIATPGSNVVYTVEAKYPEAKLLSNPAFSLGDVDVNSPLQAGTVGGNPSNNQYTITSGSGIFYPFISPLPDHTTGSGNMFISLLETNMDRVVFRKTITAAVDESFGLSFYFANIHSQLDNGENIELEIRINGVSVKTVNSGKNNNWHYAEYVYTATSTGSVSIEIVSPINSSGKIRALGLDDMNLVKLSNPKTETVSITVNTDCFEIEATTDNVCHGDSILIVATTNGLFQGWEEVGGGTSSIVKPSFLETYVKPTGTTKYVASARFPLNNQIINGDFELGDQGFDKGDLDITYAASYVSQGNYGISSNPDGLNPAYTQIGDHTSGSGNMMVIDASTPGQIVYSTSVTVEKDSTYGFSVWVANVNDDFVNPPLLTFIIDGVDLAQKVEFPDSTHAWFQFNATWKATATKSVKIQLRNDNTSGNGNDFALDDLSFAALYSEIIRDTIEVTPCRYEAKDTTAAFCEQTSGSNNTLIDLTAFEPTVTKRDVKASVVSWHTAIPATAMNIISTPTAVTAINNSNYYAVISHVDFPSGGDTAMVTITINPLPTVTFTAVPQKCVGDEVVTLTGAPVGGTFKGTGVVGDEFTVPTAPGDYELKYVYEDAIGCADSVAQTVSVKPMPTSSLTSNAPVCIGESINITLTTSAGVSATYNWTGPNSNAGTSKDFSKIGALVADGGKYIVSITDSGCVKKDSIIYVITPKPTLPVATAPADFCLDGTAPAWPTPTTLGAGNSWQWYATAGSASTTKPTIANTPIGEQTVYVYQQTDAASGSCKSDTLELTVEVIDIPAAPTAADPADFCENSTAPVWPTPTIPSTNSLLWYTASSGGTGATVKPTILNTPAGTQEIWVSQKLTAAPGCESDRTKLSVEVIAAPDAPTASTLADFCVDATAPTSWGVTADAGHSLVWHTNATTGTGSSTEPAIPNTPVGTQEIWVSQKLTAAPGCESARTKLSVNVTAATAITSVTANKTTLCEGEALTITAVATGTGTLTYEWFKDGGSVAISTTNPLSIASLASTDAGSYTVKVTGTCGDETSTPVVITINTKPTITVDPVAIKECKNTTGLSLSTAATGTPTLTYQWQKDNVNIGTNSSTYAFTPDLALTAAGDYRVIVSNGCGTATSAVAKVEVTDTEIPSVSLGTDITQGCGDGATVVTLTATPEGGGAAPKYTFFVDGTMLPGTTVDQASNSASYTLPINNGVDVDDLSFTVEMESNSLCIASNASPTVTSPAVAFESDPQVPTVNITDLDQSTCSPNFTVSTDPIGSAFKPGWTTDFGTISNTGALTFPSSGVANVEYTVESPLGLCPSKSDQVQITKLGDLSPNDILIDGKSYRSNDTVICLSSPTIELEHLNPDLSTEVGKWVLVSGSNTDFTTAAGNPKTVTATGIGTTVIGYEISKSIGGLCPADLAQVTLIVEDYSIVVGAITGGGNVCEGTPLGTAFTVNPTGGPTGSTYTYDWSVTQAGTEVDNGTGKNFTPSDLSGNATPYDVTVTVTNSNACVNNNPQKATTTFEVFENPTVVITGTGNFCPGLSTNLVATPSGMSNYKWTNSSGVQVGTNSDTYNVSIAGEYTVEVTDVNGCKATDKQTAQEVNVSANIQANPSLEVCAGQSIELSVSESNPDGYNWTMLGDPFGTTSTVTATETGVYEVTLTFGTLPGETCTKSDIVSLIFHESLPDIVQTDDTICETNPYTLQAVDLKGLEGVFTWHRVGTGAIATGSSSFTVTESGDYYAVFDNNYCELETDTVSVAVDRVPQLKVEPKVQYIEEGNSAIISVVNSTGAYYYAWEGPEIESSTDLPVIEARPEGPIAQYYITVLSENQKCEATDSAEVIVELPVKPWNSFSPNGDGLYDGWIIENLETFPNAIVEVYNRWGTLVWQSNGYKTPWYGENFRNGEPLPVATYYYIIYPNGGTVKKPKTGDVTIVR